MTQENTSTPNHETQRQRWIKYGANVLLATVVVISLAVLIIYLVEKKPRRFDTTASGLYSLKPQTLNVIKANQQPITIISLYTTAKSGQTDDDTDESAITPSVDQPSVVADLLEEYHLRGSHIDTQIIDPANNPTKVDDLIKQVEDQYGGEIKKYRSFADSVPAKYADISKLADAEVAQIKAVFEGTKIDNDQLYQTVRLAAASVEGIPQAMKEGQDKYKSFLKRKPPDYKGITDDVSTTMQSLSQLLGLVNSSFADLKNSKDLPETFRQYMTDSVPRYAAIKKQADSITEEIKGLGELKLDTLRDALKQKNPILVRGDKEWRVISYDKVWRTDARDMRSRTDSPIRPRFAGEQMITTAILSLNQPTKPKVCFVRGAGQPLTDYNGQMSTVADRLRDYNFDVTDKDLSGMYAMQAMQQQMPTAPEPSDADIDDAIWVVDGMPGQANPEMGGPPPSIAPKIADHIAHGHHWVDGKKMDGGSALLMFVPKGDDMSGALKDWGIVAHPDTIAVHKLITGEGGGQGNVVNDAEKLPPYIGIKEWGQSPITETMGSLPGILLGCIPITTKPVDGITSTALMPVPGAPNAPESWGETDFQSLDSNPTFDPKTDMPAPLFGMAAAENKSGTRLIVNGCETMFGGVVDYKDQELKKRGVLVDQFPGNSELFMNSIFWLSHQESLMAMSPAAMNVSRISDMSPAALRFWHVGVLLIGLPGLVLLAGAGVYFSRRN